MDVYQKISPKLFSVTFTPFSLGTCQLCTLGKCTVEGTSKDFRLRRRFGYFFSRISKQGADVSPTSLALFDQTCRVAKLICTCFYFDVYIYVAESYFALSKAKLICTFRPKVDIQGGGGARVRTRAPLLARREEQPQIQLLFFPLPS